MVRLDSRGNTGLFNANRPAAAGGLSDSLFLGADIFFRRCSKTCANSRLIDSDNC
jgi:hypothetical protein